jgi:hypothetical protein
MRYAHSFSYGWTLKGCPRLVTLPERNLDPTSEIAAPIVTVVSVAILPFLQLFHDTVEDRLAHELGRRHDPIPEHLVEIFVIVPPEHLGDEFRCDANVDDPIAHGMQLATREFHVDRVRGTVHPPRGSERRMAVEGMRDHDGITYREGVG